MPGLCLMTVPGLDVGPEWRPVHDRLLDEFPAVTDVLATTMPETLLIVHDGPPDGAWLDTAGATVLALRGRASSSSRPRSRRSQKLHSVVTTVYHRRYAALENLPGAPRSA
jgi:hypothetical protein